MKTSEELQKAYYASKMDFYLHPSNYAVEPFRIFGPVYYVGDKQVCVHLIDTGEGLIILDAGFPQCVHLLTESIYHLGFDPHDIKWVIITHGHYDHTGCAMEYKRLYGARVAMSRVDTEWIAGKEFMLPSTHPLVMLSAAPEIDHMIEDGEHIRLGNIDMECKLIPGHTPGAMAFFFNATEDGKTRYRVGEYGGAGIRSVRKDRLLKGGQPLSIRQDFLDSLEKMKSEHVDIQLGNHPYNNHTFEKRARQLAGEKDAFIDPEGWLAFLNETQEKLRKMYAEEEASEAEAQKG